MKTRRKISSIIVIIAMLTALFCTAVSAEGEKDGLPTASPVFVDGTEVSFQAYNIDGYNYFKLRDLAMALSGTDKQFEIGYDSENNAITITTGQPYTPLGDELTAAAGTETKQALVSTAVVYIDEIEANLSAYNIEGYNYYKLRDVAAAIDFGVTYDEETTTIGIDTSIGYMEESDTPEEAVNPLTGTWYFDTTSDDMEIRSYLIFDDNGNIQQFLGNYIAAYTADDSTVSVVADGSDETDVYDYTVSAADGMTTLNIDSASFGEMTQDGETTETGNDAIPGLWLSHNDIYDDIGDNAYFYFSKDGNVYIGIVLTGTYTYTDTTFTDTITSDGSPETSSFVITESDGTTQMTLTDSDGHDTVLIKE